MYSIIVGHKMSMKQLQILDNYYQGAMQDLLHVCIYVYKEVISKERLASQTKQQASKLLCNNYGLEATQKCKTSIGTCVENWE